MSTITPEQDRSHTSLSLRPFILSLASKNDSRPITLTGERPVGLPGHLLSGWIIDNEYHPLIKRQMPYAVRRGFINTHPTLADTFTLDMGLTDGQPHQLVLKGDELRAAARHMPTINTNGTCGYLGPVFKFEYLFDPPTHPLTTEDVQDNPAILGVHYPLFDTMRVGWDLEPFTAVSERHRPSATARWWYHTSAAGMFSGPDDDDDKAGQCAGLFTHEGTRYVWVLHLDYRQIIDYEARPAVKLE